MMLQMAPMSTVRILNDRVRAAFKALLGVSMTVMLTFWALVQLFPQVFIRIFNSDPELLETAVWTLRVYTAVVGLFGIQMAVQQTSPGPRRSAGGRS